MAPAMSVDQKENISLWDLDAAEESRKRSRDNDEASFDGDHDITAQQGAAGRTTTDNYDDDDDIGDDYVCDLTQPVAAGESSAAGEGPSNNDHEADLRAFFAEAGLSEETLASLGINRDELLAQKDIVEELERSTKRDLELAQQIQAQFDQEARLSSNGPSLSTNPSINNALSAPSTLNNAMPASYPVTQPTLVRANNQHFPKRPRLQEIRPAAASSSASASSSSGIGFSIPTASSSNAASLPNRNRGKQPAVLVDSDSDLIDLTEEDALFERGSSYEPIDLDGLPASFRPQLSFNSALNRITLVDDSLDEEEEDANMLSEEEMPGFFASFLGDIHLQQQHNERMRMYERYGVPAVNRYKGFPMPDYERPLDPGQSEAELRALLANVCDDEQVLAEAKQPVSEGLTTLLMEHQVIGVNWMKRQEASSNKGGILSDDMGLGKTLQAIALIKERPCDPATLTEASSSGEKTKTKGTLVICPVSLISQWQREIYTKTNPPLSVLVYHGTSRPSDPRKLLAYDVVISSYHVLIQDYGKNDTYTGPLAKLKWHRVILDEAHVIKNKATSMARSCCLVDAQYRWCLTATPIQNKIEELFSLIKFLRIRPYCEWDEFREEISKPMRQGLHKRALKKVQILLKAISLRRSKQAKINGKPILQLPERTVHFTHIDFSPDERQFYEYINSKAQARFNKYLEAGTVMKNYSSVLVLLLRLRQACLHPSLTLKENPDEEEESECKKEKIARTMTSTVVNRLLHENTNFSDIECPICMDMADQAQIIAGCGHILCRECLFNYINTADGLVKRCPQCRGPLDRECVTSLEAFLKVHARDLYNTFVKDNSVTEETAAAISRAKEFLSSAKIDKLLEILQETHETTGGQDKTIVFSQFMGMLDIVETALKQKGYKTVRYDGSMNVKQRDAALACFFANPEVTVLLVSTKCGSLGLNLTVANRVVMMDIWWNPALENQAIDRVHRIGQTKPVEVHRIFITDTVEDRILELQKKKQALCDGALGEGTGRPLGRLGLNEMLYLFRGGTLRGDDDDD